MPALSVAPLKGVEDQFRTSRESPQPPGRVDLQVAHPGGRQPGRGEGITAASNWRSPARSPPAPGPRWPTIASVSSRIVGRDDGVIGSPGGSALQVAC